MLKQLLPHIPPSFVFEIELALMLILFLVLAFLGFRNRGTAATKAARMPLDDEQ